MNFSFLFLFHQQAQLYFILKHLTFPGKTFIKRHGLIMALKIAERKT
jgi:hypothetical protein